MYQTPSSDLVFITQTGPKKRKDQQQLIRQHVMKDIGRSRRKHKSKEKPKSLQFSLEVPSPFDFASLTPGPKALNGDEVPDQLSRNSGHSRPFGDAATEVSLRPWAEPTPQARDGNSQLSIRRGSPATLNIERLWTGRGDPFMQYPIEVNRRTLELMDHVFDERYGNTPPFRDAWMPIGLLHPATFYQVLSNAALTMSQSKVIFIRNDSTLTDLASLRSHNSVPEEKESMLHHNTALKIIAKQIPNHEKSISDGVLGAIIGFACYSHVIGKQAQHHMHMKVVVHLIALRGGIETLYLNPLLRIVLFWVDVGGAVTEDVHPHFPIPTRIIPHIQVPEDMPTSLLARQISNSWRWSFPDQAEIMNIMDDLRSFNFILKQQNIQTNGAVYKDGLQAANGILPLMHRLLSLSSGLLNEEYRKLDIVRLGCILYFAEIRRLFGIMAIISTYQLNKLRLLLEKEEDSWGSLEILKAWVLALAAMESTGQERQWFFDRLQASKDRLDVSSTWEAMEERFKDILWYDGVHSVMFGEVLSGVEINVSMQGLLLGGSRFGGYRPL